jgi:hypothetical protein
MYSSSEGGCAPDQRPTKLGGHRRRGPPRTPLWGVGMSSSGALGDYERRLKALADAESARADDRTREADRQRQLEVAVRAYVAQRMPSAPMEDAERASLAATLAENARQLLDDDPPDVEEVWGALGFTVEEFREERRSRLHDWLLADQLNLRLRHVERRQLAIRQWEEYFAAVRTRVVPPLLNRLCLSDTRSLHDIEQDRAELEESTGRLHVSIHIRGVGLAGSAGLPASPVEVIEFEEWLRPGAAPGDSLTFQPLQTDGTSPIKKRPYRIQGLSVPDTRRRLREVLMLEEQGLRSKDIGDRFGVPDTTARTWLKQARIHRDLGLL